MFSNLENEKLLAEILKTEYDHSADEFGYADIYKNESILFISNGCMNNCSFCKATFQKLPLKSADIEYVKDAIDFIDSEGVEKLIVRGTNICQYGYDLYHDYKLPEVIEHIESKKNIKEIDLIGFGFKEAIHNDFKSTLEKCQKDYKISGSLESGSNRLLKLIRKGFTAEEFVDFVTDIDKFRYAISIIAGFPTETLEDIKMTLDVLNAIKLGKFEICRYVNSSFVDSNKYEQLSPEEIQEHARIYQKGIKNQNRCCTILGNDYK